MNLRRFELRCGSGSFRDEFRSGRGNSFRLFLDTKMSPPKLKLAKTATKFCRSVQVKLQKAEND